MIIYCIEDINDLKYVGKTNRKLHDRWRRHVSDKYNPNAHGPSSSKLNLLNSIIYPLEECEEEVSKERERYWINKLDCVNENKLHCDVKIYTKKWNDNNRGRKREQQKKYREKNKDKINAKERERYKLKKEQLKIKSTE